ncbi:MAG: hypothetical protein ACRDRI_17625 [Pseudonocardiaceae bacterium]
MRRTRPPGYGQVEALRRVTLPAIPTVYCLADPDGGVTSGVFALPADRRRIELSEPHWPPPPARRAHPEADAQAKISMTTPRR